jgi:hypothetical protein
LRVADLKCEARKAPNPSLPTIIRQAHYYVYSPERLVLSGIEGSRRTIVNFAGKGFEEGFFLFFY